MKSFKKFEKYKKTGKERNGESVVHSYFSSNGSRVINDASCQEPEHTNFSSLFSLPENEEAAAANSVGRPAMRMCLGVHGGATLRLESRTLERYTYSLLENAELAQEQAPEQAKCAIGLTGEHDIHDGERSNKNKFCIKIETGSGGTRCAKKALMNRAAQSGEMCVCLVLSLEHKKWTSRIKSY